MVTITDLNVYRQHLSSTYKNINHFSTIGEKEGGFNDEMKRGPEVKALVSK